MKDDQFDKLFKYIVDMDARFSKRFDTIEADVRGLYDAPDRDAQWNRLLKWAHEVSKKTGVPLPDL